MDIKNRCNIVQPRLMRMITAYTLPSPHPIRDIRILRHILQQNYYPSPLWICRDVDTKTFSPILWINEFCRCLVYLQIFNYLQSINRIYLAIVFDGPTGSSCINNLNTSIPNIRFSHLPVIRMLGRFIFLNKILSDAEISQNINKNKITFLSRV